MINVVKEHPYMTAGGVFVAGVILVVILFSGNDKATPVAATSPGVDPSIVAANTQLAMTQLQQQAATNQAAQAASVANAQIAADVQKAQLAMQGATGVAQITANATVSVAQAQADAAKYASTLALQAQQAAINADVTKTQNNNSTAIQLAQVDQKTSMFSQFLKYGAEQMAAGNKTNSATAINAANQLAVGGTGGTIDFNTIDQMHARGYVYNAAINQFEGAH